MREVSRWQAGVVASIALVGGGFVVGSAGLVLAAAVPLVYSAYAAVASVQDPARSLAVERTLDPGAPIPGERVAVTLSVTNESDRTMPDVRVAEGVPDGVEPVSGSATLSTALRPGETAALEYELQPRRGTYSFREPRVRGRSVSAAAVGTATLSPAGQTEFDCRMPVDGVPVHRLTTSFVGSVPTDSGGAGHEFHSTREYRRGDSLRRVDWRRYAKTGALGTIRFREQEAARALLLVDGRAAARVADAPDQPDGVTLAAYAGMVTASALADGGHQVGVAALGTSTELPGVYDGPPAFVEPGVGTETLGRIARVCDAVAAHDPSGTPRPSSREQLDTASGGVSVSSSGRPGNDGPARADGDGTVDRIDALASPDTQLVVCAPIVDDAVVDLIGSLRRRGRETTVVAPAVTGTETVGGRVETLRRTARLTELRRLDVPVVDWDPETPLAAALGPALEEVVR